MHFVELELRIKFDMLIIGSCYAWCSTEHVLKFGSRRYEYSVERRCQVYALSARVA